MTLPTEIVQLVTGLQLTQLSINRYYLEEDRDEEV